MLVQARYKLAEGRFSVQVWDLEKEEVVRAVVGRKDRVEFEKQVNQTFLLPDDCQYKAEFLTLNPSKLAHDLPGINSIVKNPATGAFGNLFSVIINLNDNHGWTREKIADWIETLDEVPTFGQPEEDNLPMKEILDGNDPAGW